MPPSRVITQVRRIPEQNSPIQPTFQLDDNPSSLTNSPTQQTLIFFSHKATVLVVFIVIWYAIYIVFAVFTGFRKFHRSIFRRATPRPIYFMKEHDNFKESNKSRYSSGKIARLASIGSSSLDTIPENMYPSFGNV